MRTTLVLEVSDELSDFINNQQGLVDPSALVNKLLHEEKARGQGQSAGQRSQVQAKPDQDTQAMEEFVDQQIPPAG